MVEPLNQIVLASTTKHWQRAGFLAKLITGTSVLFTGLVSCVNNDVNETTSPHSSLYSRSIFNSLNIKSDDAPAVAPKPEQETEPISDSEHCNKLREIKGFGQRQDYINNLFKELNPELLPSLPFSSRKTALAEFNKEKGMSFVCLGVRDKSNDPSYYYPDDYYDEFCSKGNEDGFNDYDDLGCEFVFIDTNYFVKESTFPRRIAISFDEARSVTSKEGVKKLLEQKLDQHISAMEAQYKVWQLPQEYDFPKNNGALMIALELEGLPGMETDAINSINIYHGYYGMTVSALNVASHHREELNKLLKKPGYENLPALKSADKDQILNDLKQALIKAIDDKKAVFMFHYLMHGGDNGSIYATDQTFTGKDLAQVISTSYKGRPLCDQIDIVMWAGSCYSGRQLDDVKKYFNEHKDIAVKNLRFITESEYTSAGASTTRDNVSLVSDLDIMNDASGPLDYFRAWYREYINYLENQGFQIPNKSASYLWEVKFADLMTRYETYSNQNALGFHYVRDPKKDITTGNYFTDF